MKNIYCSVLNTCRGSKLTILQQFLFYSIHFYSILYNFYFSVKRRHLRNHVFDISEILNVIFLWCEQIHTL